jgi:hypothetical protein
MDEEIVNPWAHARPLGPSVAFNSTPPSLYRYFATPRLLQRHSTLPPSPLKHDFAMAEGLAIAGTVIALFGAVKQLSGNLNTLATRGQHVDTAIQSVGIEVENLSTVLRSLGSSLNDPAIAVVIFESQTTFEERHWNDVKQVLKDCGGSVEALEQIWASLRDAQPRLFRKSRLQNDYDKKVEELALLRQQIVSYRETLHLSFAIIEM